MNTCKICKGDSCNCYKDLGLLLLRLILGVVFIYHGWSKVSNIEGTLGFFSQIGLGNVALVYLAAYGEFLGGILMVLGLWTRFVALVLVVLMAVAIQTIYSTQLFSAMAGGYEYALTLLAVSAAVAMLGAGKYSVDANMHHKMKTSEMK